MSEEWSRCLCGNNIVLINDIAVDANGAMQDNWSVGCKYCGLQSWSYYDTQEEALAGFDRAMRNWNKGANNK